MAEFPYPKPFKQPPVRVFPSPSGTVVFVGTGHHVGTYVLRMRVAEPLDVDFRPKSGRTTVHFEPGDYCYVGSGHGGLAHRVLRHADRSGGQPPHPIRDAMLAAFRQARLATPARPAREKTLGAWNVDYLLDRPAVDLVEAFLIRWPKRIEPYVGRRIESDPRAVVVEPGLGGGEYHGSKQLTLLLRIDAGEAWWRGLPRRLARWSLGAALNHFHSPFVDELLDDGRLSDRQIVTVLNMSDERATVLLRRMINDGAAFGRADRESRGVSDTVNGGEIVRRLDRGGGSVTTAVAALGGAKRHLIADEPRRREVAQWARDLKAAVGRLRRALARACPGRDRPSAPAVEPPASSRSRRHPGRSSDPSFAQVVGKLKQCVYFLDKSSRDLPLMVTRSRPLPTLGERQEIRRRLGRIAADADALLRICADRP